MDATPPVTGGSGRSPGPPLPPPRHPPPAPVAAPHPRAHDAARAYASDGAAVRGRLLDIAV